MTFGGNRPTDVHIESIVFVKWGKDNYGYYLQYGIGSSDPEKWVTVQDYRSSIFQRVRHELDLQITDKPNEADIGALLQAINAHPARISIMPIPKQNPQIRLLETKQGDATNGWGLCTATLATNRSHFPPREHTPWIWFIRAEERLSLVALTSQTHPIRFFCELEGQRYAGRLAGKLLWEE